MSEHSLHTWLTLATKYGLPTVHSHCHQMAMAVHCVNQRVCVRSHTEMLSNRWSNLILVSFLPRCPLALAVRCWCYLGFTSTLSASFLESAPPITLPHPDLPPDLHPSTCTLVWQGQLVKVALLSVYLGQGGNASEHNSAAFTPIRRCPYKLESNTDSRCETVKAPELVWCCDYSCWSKRPTYMNSHIDTDIMPDLENVRFGSKSEFTHFALIWKVACYSKPSLFINRCLQGLHWRVIIS